MAGWLPRQAARSPARGALQTQPAGSAPEPLQQAAWAGGRHGAAKALPRTAASWPHASAAAASPAAERGREPLRSRLRPRALWSKLQVRVQHRRAWLLTRDAFCMLGLVPMAALHTSEKCESPPKGALWADGALLATWRGHQDACGMLAG